MAYNFAEQEQSKSEFNMSLKSLERIHNLFQFINSAPLTNEEDFDINKKASAYLSLYEEVDAMMSDEERKYFIPAIQNISILFDEVNNAQMAKISSDNPIQRGRADVGISKAVGKLNAELLQFGINIRRILQKRGMLFKISEDSRLSMLR